MAAILAIETSSDICSVALQVGNKVFREEQAEPRAHARLLLPAIKLLLARAALAVTELDGVVYGRGPGSFTGLRVGCAVVQGLAWAQALPTLGVSSLALLAEVARRQIKAVDGVFAVLDAHMGGFYIAAFSGEKPDHVIIDDQLVTGEMLSGILESLVQGSPGRWVIAGDGAESAAGSLAAEVIVANQMRPDAEALLALAAPQVVTDGELATEVRPAYLRDEYRWQRQ